MFYTAEVACNYNERTLETTNIVKNIKRVIKLVSFVPFLYKKHPFCYTLYNANDTYVLLAKEVVDGNLLNISTIKRRGKDVVIDYNLSLDVKAGKTLSIRGKTFTYILVQLQDVPFSGINVETRLV